MDYRKIGFWQLVILALLLNFVVQTIHEAGHWAVLEISGRRPVWGFNQLIQIWDGKPVHPEEWTETTAPDGEKGWLRMSSASGKTEFNIMLVAGPLASLFGVVLALSLSRWNRNRAIRQMALMMALLSSLIMSVYYLRGFNRLGGDEYFLAANMGIPKYIIDIPFGLAFIIAFITGVWTLGDWRTRLKWFGAIVLGSIPSALFIVKANTIVQNQVDLDNPFFISLLGWSLPVLVVNVIACLALWLWWRRTNKIYNNPVSDSGN